MEQFDEILGKLNYHKLVDRIQSFGYLSEGHPTSQFTKNECISESLKILRDYVQQKEDPSLIHFIGSSIFLKLQSKKDTGAFCNQLIQGLYHQIHEFREFNTILYLFCVDYALDLSRFYLASRERILDYFQQPKTSFLDSLQIKLDDWINIALRQFPEESQQKIIQETTKLISFDMVSRNQYDPYKHLSGSRFQQVLIKLYVDIRKRNLEQNLKQPTRTQQHTQDKQSEDFDIFKGFYRWDSPLFRREEFLKNPQNQKMLSNLYDYRKKYPIMSANYNVTPIKKKKQSNANTSNTKISPMKMPKDTAEERQQLKSRLQKLAKEKTQNALTFNLSMNYYKNIKPEHIHHLLQLETMHLEFEELNSHHSLTSTEPEEYSKQRNVIQKLRTDIENYERKLRIKGILPPSILDELVAAGRVTFQEPDHKQNLLKSQLELKSRNRLVFIFLFLDQSSRIVMPTSVVSVREVLDSGCIYADQYKKKDTAILRIIHEQVHLKSFIYQLVMILYTSIQRLLIYQRLSKVFISFLYNAKDIDYQSMVDIFNALVYKEHHQPQTYISKSFFLSKDPRYLALRKSNESHLRVQLDESLQAISGFDDWLIGKNSLGHIGCFAVSYTKQI